MSALMDDAMLAAFTHTRRGRRGIAMRDRAERWWAMYQRQSADQIGEADGVSGETVRRELVYYGFPLKPKGYPPKKDTVRGRLQALEQQVELLRRLLDAQVAA